MKYRVRMDMSFQAETDAQSLMNAGKNLADRAVSPETDAGGAVPSFCELEMCLHDEGLPCAVIERVQCGGGQ
jgi:hypothetical protein